MPRTRRNVWKLAQPWDDVLLWYARAVGELQTRPITDPTSWASLGAMHGFDQDLWIALGYIARGAPLPPSAVQARLWQQCQHQTWYFLSWHRGYLAAFEAIVRSAVVKLGGPADWALPYWNYSTDVQSRRLPAAFADTKLPDGQDNPLFTERRYGRGDGTIVIDPRDVMLTALNERYYTGTGPNGATGFGGLKTEFSHFATAGDETHNYNGQLEGRPHNILHVRIGGFDPSDSQQVGLMTNPDTAALDPIFWLHHANIDRLWKTWLQQTLPRTARPDQFKNPADAGWLDGPRDRKFVMPRPDGTEYTFTSRDVTDTTAPALDYVYEEEQPPQPATPVLEARLERLGVAPGRAAEIAGAVVMSPLKEPELVGANDSVLRLNSPDVETAVRLDRGARNDLLESMKRSTLESATPHEPDHVYLNLENIKSPTDAAIIYVYINLPAGANPDDHPECFAGAVSLFGARKATAADGPHGGNGISESLDITTIVDRLHINDALGPELSVKFVAGTPNATDKITIDRVSIYRQGH